MRLKGILAVAAVLALAVALPALAQQTEIAGDMVTVKGTVEAIDHTNRVLTLKMEDGEFDSITIPKGAKRFDEVKVGDTLQIRYYDNVTARLKEPGEPAVDTAEVGATPSESASPGGTISTQRKMTVTVTAVDREKGVATYEGPHGYKYSRRLQNSELAEKIKAGDRLDVTWTEAVQISVNP
jgi:hypothetical protein